MTYEEFWSRIEKGAEKLSIPKQTVRVWKHRERVSRVQAMNIYQSLLGTDNEIPLSLISKSQVTANDFFHGGV